MKKLKTQNYMCIQRYMKTRGVLPFLAIAIAIAFSYPSEVSAKMREDVEVELKGPRGGSVSAAAVKKNSENTISAVDFARTIESGGDVQNTTYNPDGTISSVLYSGGLRANYSYIKNAKNNIESCQVRTKNFTLNLKANKSGAIRTADIRLADEASDRKGLVVVFEPSDTTPTMHDISHKPIPLELISGINKALDDLAKTKSSALEDYNISSSEYYNTVESALRKGKETLMSQGIDVDTLLEDMRKSGIPEEARRRVIDEAVGYINAAATRDKTGHTAREFIDSEKRAKDMILVSALKTYNGKIKEAVEYINKIIESLMKSKLSIFMSADKDKIDAIINLPEIKKSTPEK